MVVVVWGTWTGYLRLIAVTSDPTVARYPAWQGTKGLQAGWCTSGGRTRSEHSDEARSFGGEGVAQWICGQSCVPQLSNMQHVSFISRISMFRAVIDQRWIEYEPL